MCRGCDNKGRTVDLLKPFLKEGVKLQQVIHEEYQEIYFTLGNDVLVVTADGDHGGYYHFRPTVVTDLKLYDFIDEDWREMSELYPHLQDTLNPDRWVILLSNTEHGIYDVIVVGSQAEALAYAEDPDLEWLTGYDCVNAIWHNGKELTITVTLS